MGLGATSELLRCAASRNLRAEAVNWARTRSYFPVVQELAYLNHAGVAPISTRVEEALARYAAEATRRGMLRYASFFDAEVERVRGRAAELLGAAPEEIAFVKNTTEGLGLVAGGLVLGLAGYFALSSFITSLLYRTAPTDPLTLAVAPLLLALVAIAACVLPARRATKVDPMVALRAE